VDKVKSRSSFIANMCLQLMQPMNAIVEHGERLLGLADEHDLDEVAPDLEKVHRAAKAFLDLVKDLLDLSKVDDPELDLKAVGSNMRHDLRTP
jgi:signal transduction histidine kinase